MQDTPAIKFTNAKLAYGKKVICPNLNLEIQQGEVFSLLGKSGSGKSTIIKAIAGLLPLQDGTLHLNGRDAARIPPEKRETPLLFQDLQLFPHLNVLDNLNFGLKMRGIRKKERDIKARNFLDKLGLSDYENRSVSSLSGGEQQRIALGRAVLTNPQILLLDEPFSSLDLDLRQQMRALVREIQIESGFTCVFVTHDLGEALTLSNRLAIIDQGKIQFTGDSKSVFHHEAAAKYIRPWRNEVELITKYL